MQQYRLSGDDQSEREKRLTSEIAGHGRQACHDPARTNRTAYWPSRRQGCCTTQYRLSVRDGLGGLAARIPLDVGGVASRLAHLGIGLRVPLKGAPAWSAGQRAGRKTSEHVQQQPMTCVPPIGRRPLRYAPATGFVLGFRATRCRDVPESRVGRPMDAGFAGLAHHAAAARVRTRARPMAFARAARSRKTTANTGSTAWCQLSCVTSSERSWLNGSK
jgi:hypothetical protein